MKHTQGPWDIGYGHSSNAYGIFTKKMLDEGLSESPICLISPTDQKNEQDEANAKLIAAAPELLLLLQEIVYTYHPAKGGIDARISRSLLERSLEAINKATL